MDEFHPSVFAQPVTLAVSLSEIPSGDIDSVASLIEQTAWELAVQAGLEFLISPNSSCVFDITDPTEHFILAPSAADIARSNKDALPWFIVSWGSNH